MRCYNREILFTNLSIHYIKQSVEFALIHIPKDLHLFLFMWSVPNFIIMKTSDSFLDITTNI